MSRHMLYGPVAFGLIGGALGVSLAMLLHHQPNDCHRVYIDDSVPIAFLGGALGALAPNAFSGLNR